MKIVARYLVERYGHITEVIELENGSFYVVITTMKGVNYEYIEADEFYELREMAKKL